MNLVTEVSMKTLIRRIVALILAMLCTFAVFACKAVEQPDSSKEPGNTKQPDATPTGTQYTPPTNGSPYNVTIENEIDCGSFIEAKASTVYNPENIDIQILEAGKNTLIDGTWLRLCVAPRQENGEEIWDIYLAVNDTAHKLGTIEEPFDGMYSRFYAVIADVNDNGFDTSDIFVQLVSLNEMYTFRCDMEMVEGVLFTVGTGSATITNYAQLAGKRYITWEYGYEDGNFVLKNPEATISSYFVYKHYQDIEPPKFSVIKEFEAQTRDENRELVNMTIPVGHTVYVTMPPIYRDGNTDVTMYAYDPADESSVTQYLVDYNLLRDGGVLDGDITIIEYYPVLTDFAVELMDADGTYAMGMLTKDMNIRFRTYSPQDSYIYFETYDGQSGRLVFADGKIDGASPWDLLGGLGTDR